MFIPLEWQFPVWTLIVGETLVPASVHPLPAAGFGRFVPIFTTREKADAVIAAANLTKAAAPISSLIELYYLLAALRSAGAEHVGIDTERHGIEASSRIVPIADVLASLAGK